MSPVITISALTTPTSATPSSGADKGLFGPPSQNITFPPGIAPLQSPAPDQNPFPASDMGLSFFGTMVLVGIVGVLLALSVSFATKCWRKRQARKAEAQTPPLGDAEKQAGRELANRLREPSLLSALKGGAGHKIELLSSGTPAGIIAANDQEKQFIIGNSDTTEDITDNNNISNTILAEKSDSAEQSIPKNPGTTDTSNPSCNTTAGHYGQPLCLAAEGVEEEDITEVFGYLFMNSGDISLESLSEECGNTPSPQELKSINNSNSEAPTSSPSTSVVASFNTPSLTIQANAPLLPSCARFESVSASSPVLHLSTDELDHALSDTEYDSTTLTNTAPITSPLPSPSRDSTSPLSEGHSPLSAFKIDCFPSTAPYADSNYDIELNPNPPQKYAADFEAYCRAREDIRSATKANTPSSTPSPDSKDIEHNDLAKESDPTTHERLPIATETPPVTSVAMHASCEDITTPERDIPVTSQQGIPTSKTTPASKTTTRPTQRTSHATPLKTPPTRAAPTTTTTHLTVPKISRRTGRMVEPRKAPPALDSGSSSSSSSSAKQRKRSVTILAPRKAQGDTVGAEERGKARGDALARQTLALMRSSAGRAGGDPSPPSPKRAPHAVARGHEGTASSSGLTRNFPTPSVSRPLRARNTNTDINTALESVSTPLRRSALIRKGSPVDANTKGARALSAGSVSHTRENSPVLPINALRRNLRVRTSTTGSISGGIQRKPTTIQRSGAQSSQVTLTRF